MEIPCDVRANSHFKPTGKLRRVGKEMTQNPATPFGTVWSARLFVGFSVGQMPKWKVDDLIEIVRRVREAQGESADASFLIQKGIYTHRTGEVVTEDGAQVIIIGEGDASWLPFLARVPKKFRRHIIELAETIARDMEQELVIVEFQRGGVVKETLGVSA